MIPIARPVVDNEEIRLVEEVLRSGELASGRFVNQFEREFAVYNGTCHAVATSNGTTALHAAFTALNLEEGAEVLTTGFTFIATANSIVYNGLRPVFVDVDPETYNIDPSDIRRALKNSKNPKALLVVHLYGRPCNMAEIQEICQEHNLALIEDCAQAHGARYEGRMVGTFGDVATYSFYPTKNMTTGEGGMVVTNNEDLANSTRMFINHGASRRYYHEIVGHNFRLTNIAAALGIAQLKKINDFNRRRQTNAQTLTEGLRNLSWLATPLEQKGIESVYHQYTVRVVDGNRDEFVNYLNSKGIGSGIHYPIPVYLQPSYQQLGYGNSRLENTETLCKQVVSLPVHPSLSEDDLAYIIDSIKSY